MAKDQDKHLEEYLSGKDGISSLYAQRPPEEPSATVDESILQASRDAVSRKNPGTGPFSGHWQIPAALAAVLVLAVGITLTFEKQPGDETYQVEQYSPDRSASETKLKKSSGKTPLQTESAPADSGSQSTRRDSGAEERNRIAPVAEPAPASSGQAASKSAPSAPAKAKLYEAPQGLSVESTTRTEPASGDRVEQEPGAVPLEGQAAARWLESIQALAKQNKIEEARQQLKDFRRVYPDYPVPETLQKLVK